MFNGTSSLLNGWRIGQSGIISASDGRRGVGAFSALWHNNMIGMCNLFDWLLKGTSFGCFSLFKIEMVSDKNNFEKSAK
jgi:hypothetical protein